MVEAADTFEFELVEPEQVLIDGPMWQAVLPGFEGDFGVRVNHCALVSALRPGIVSIWRTEGEAPHQYFVSGGFADVTADNCTVLAEEAVDLRDLSRPHLQQDLQDLNEELSLANDPDHAALIERAIAIVEAKLAVVGDGK
ncbi:MAG: ATP synthase F1 subunit epsilon [Alphaproteobacteria bacterium]|nr:ATP synthase F1 subunit epsilon [Alphaproteobacteria bacterium]